MAQKGFKRAENDPKMGPKAPQKALRWPQVGPNLAQESPNRAQNGPKMSPRPPQKALREAPKQSKITLPRLANIEA